MKKNKVEEVKENFWSNTICNRFIDDFGYYVYPYKLDNYMSRYYFFKGHM